MCKIIMKDVMEDNMSKRTILYGVGLRGEKCYWLHNSQYCFEYCIDRRSKIEFHGLKVYSFEEKVDDLSDCFIIVAVVEHVYKEIKINLEAAGFVEFKDFIWDVFLTEKRLALIYGNCHMWVLTDYLRKNRHFAEEYFPYYVSVFEGNISEELLVRCDLFISQDIREENTMGCPSSDYYKGRGYKFIQIPNIYGFHTFFPQVKEEYRHEMHLGKNAIELESRKDYEILNIRSIIFALSKVDENIDRLYKENALLDDICEYILYGNAYSSEEIISTFQKELNKIKKREEKCDVEISTYIANHYREIQLFYDPSHPTNDLIREYGRQILSILGIKIDESISLMRHLDRDEVFIYGCVKKALDMNFTQSRIRIYNEEDTLGLQALNLKEYVREYVAWHYGERLE